MILKLKKKIITDYLLSRASQVALVIKNPPANAEDTRDRFNPGSGRYPGEENGNPLQCSYS